MLSALPRGPYRSFPEYAGATRCALEEELSAQLVRILKDLPVAEEALLEENLRAGKKIRGTLLCLLCEAFGGRLAEARPRAVAVELIQAATLIHDDLVDGDTLRRGAPAVWTIEGARRSVLIGDLVFASALRMASHLGRREGWIASHAIAEIARGACLEPVAPESLAQAVLADRLPVGLYARIIGLKTAVLFGAACQLGAVAAGADASGQAACHAYGLRIGEAYQIADDREDLRRLLARGVEAPGRVAPLVPALLHFAPERSALVPGLLRGEAEPEALELFRVAEERMEAEIGERLSAAVRALDVTRLEGEFAALARSAPLDLLQMFIGS